MKPSDCYFEIEGFDDERNTDPEYFSVMVFPKKGKHIDDAIDQYLEQVLELDYLCEDAYGWQQYEDDVDTFKIGRYKTVQDIKDTMETHGFEFREDN